MMARRIFRTAALQKYNERLEQVVLPRYASPPWILIFWAVCGLLLLSVALLWAAPAPVYVTAWGVVVAAPTNAANLPAADEAIVAVFLDPELIDNVQSRQPAFLQFAGGSDAAADREQHSRVISVEPTVLAPVTARARYQLDAATALLIEGPVSVALVEFDGPTSRWLGAVAEVRIEIGAQSGLALLPGLGQFFEIGF